MCYYYTYAGVGRRFSYNSVSPLFVLTSSRTVRREYIRT